ncbi:MAG: PDZ domain-containing protein [Gemmatimonadetes bacterium]|nr:PDZ domain-containing protein [Gemmatimonadota bacterium]
MRLKWAVMVVVVAGAFFGGGWLLRRARPAVPPRVPTIGAGTQTKPVGSGLFRSVFETIRRNAVDSLDEQAIYRLATTGMLAELGDPYAALVPGNDSGPVGSLGEPPVQGIYLDQADGFVEVVSVVRGSPAETAGVRPGDAILAVDRTQVNLQRAEQVAKLIDGPVGSTVRLRLGRSGRPGSVAVTVTRAATTPPAPLEVVFAAPGLPRLRPARVDSVSLGSLRRALDSLRPKSAILDLRGVADGELSAAIAAADLFLEAEAVIGAIRSRTTNDSTVHRDGTADQRPDLALVVLVDRGTAGPAEFLAGALQDNDRAVLVGESTYGRGAGQTLFPMGNGNSLRLTTTVWVTPSGRVIQRFPEPEGAEGAAPADTGAARPRHTTAGGRSVLGGGGIVPDREIEAGDEPSAAGDPVLELAKRLLERAKDRQALLAAVADPK